MKTNTDQFLKQIVEVEITNTHIAASNLSLFSKEKMSIICTVFTGFAVCLENTLSVDNVNFLTFSKQ